MCEMPGIDWVANCIHEWGEPGQNIWKQMFLSRIGSAALVALETVSVLFESMNFLVVKIPQGICSLNSQGLVSKVSLIGKMVLGAISSIFFGVVFSPELNFFFHRKLGLAVDDIALRKEKALQVMLKEERKAVELRQKKEAELSRFEKERMKAEVELDEELDAELAELLKR